MKCAMVTSMTLNAGARPVSKATSRPAAKVLPKLGGLAAGAHLLLSTGLAKAEELSIPAEVTSAGSDLAALFQDNPLLVFGGSALLLLPLGIGLILNLGPGGPKVKTTSAARALEALGENPKVILVDIRSKAEVREQGSPDLKAVKRKAVQLPYIQVVKGEASVDEAFGEKFAKIGGLDAETRVLLLDADGQQALAAGKVLLATGTVEQVYVIEGGAEGAKGWKESGLPWKNPSRGFDFSLPAIDLSALSLNNLPTTLDTLAEDFKTAPTLTKAGLAGAAFVGAAFLLINEIELVLELVGIVAAGQLALKLLFAEDREQTLTEIRTLVNDKIAVAEAGEDLKKLATVLLEDDSSKAAEPKPSVAAAATSENGAAAAAAPAAPAEAVAAVAEAAPAEEAKPEPTPVAVAVAAEELPENVKEAQEWIESWKAKSSKEASA